MTDIYLVIIEDRHTDVEVLAFSSASLALAHATLLLEQYGGKVDDEDEDLSPGAIADGWLFYARYSFEGDSIRVMKREMDA